MAVGRGVSTLIVAAIGLVSGQLYRSELADLKQYRLPASVVKFGNSYLLRLVGSLHPPVRTLVALPERRIRSSAIGQDSATADVNNSIAGNVSTSPQPTIVEASTRGSGGSVVREWVDELTGRAQNAAAGLRVPTEAEIVQVTSMFPDIDRQVIVASLQRR
jgi:hypothetical protein